MAARSRLFAPISAVDPAWLEARLGRPDLRILDVRTDAPSDDASGTRLRAAGNVELRGFPHLGGPPGWKISRERHAGRRGRPAVYVRGHVPGAVALDVRAVLFDDAGEVVSAPEIAIAMSSLGVGDGHTIVLVDEGRPEAALAAAWALVRYGHHDVHVLQGGFTRWAGEGRAVSREAVRHPAASFTARVSS
ncbi:MAG: Thiosulfate sulfurtransferase, rhodanese [Labilithrix sp.]|nr:Thiosulfate sulfurtransferase, rhodanese [Labilithrix sp.]